MKTLDEVRDDLGRVNTRINTAIGMALSARGQSIAAELLLAGEGVDSAIDDLSEIDQAPSDHVTESDRG